MWCISLSSLLWHDRGQGPATDTLLLHFGGCKTPFRSHKWLERDLRQSNCGQKVCQSCGQKILHVGMRAAWFPLVCHM